MDEKEKSRGRRGLLIVVGDPSFLFTSDFDAGGCKLRSHDARLQL